MESFHGIQPFYSFCGFLVGALVGMTGMGGGSLLTPMLILLFGINPKVAVGTDLIYACLTKMGGSVFHGFARNIDWSIVLRLAAGSVPAACATLLVLAKVETVGSPQVISRVLAFALFSTALALLFRDRLLKLRSQTDDSFAHRRGGALTVAVGAVLGILVPISSVGAGALGVTALIFLYPRVPLIRIVGSDIAHAVPLTLVAGLGHLALGGVKISILLSLLVGSLPGIAVGTYSAIRLSQQVLRYVMAVVLTLIGIKLLT